MANIMAYIMDSRVNLLLKIENKTILPFETNAMLNRMMNKAKGIKYINAFFNFLVFPLVKSNKTEKTTSVAIIIGLSVENVIVSIIKNIINGERT